MEKIGDFFGFFGMVLIALVVFTISGWLLLGIGSWLSPPRKITEKELEQLKRRKEYSRARELRDKELKERQEQAKLDGSADDLPF